MNMIDTQLKLVAIRVVESIGRNTDIYSFRQNIEDIKNMLALTESNGENIFKSQDKKAKRLC